MLYITNYNQMSGNFNINIIKPEDRSILGLLKNKFNFEMIPSIYFEQLNRLSNKLFIIFNVFTITYFSYTYYFIIRF